MPKVKAALFSQELLQESPPVSDSFASTCEEDAEPIFDRGHKVDAVTGIDFVPELPDPQETALEAFRGAGLGGVKLQLNYSSKVWRIGYLNSPLANSGQVRRAVTEAIYVYTYSLPVRLRLD